MIYPPYILLTYPHTPRARGPSYPHRNPTGIDTMLRVALLSALTGLAATQRPHGAFIEQDELVVIAVEEADAGPAGDWEHENTLTGVDGSTATGTGYYIWRGPNVHNTPGLGE